MKIVKQTPRNSWWLFIGIIGVSALGWFINSFSPDTIIIRGIFFAIIFATITSLSLYTLNNVRRSLLIGLGIPAFFLLRYLGLREPIYLILLIASLASLELFFQKR